MVKLLLATSLVAALVSFVSADGPGYSSGLEARQPYTNAEAFARGLPPLRPRHRGSRTWTAAKRHQSPILHKELLQFDDEAFFDIAGPIPSPYQGIDLGCVYTGCGYVRSAKYPAWTGNSSPNAMYFYVAQVPTFTNAVTGGTLRLGSLYCTQSDGALVAQLTVTGTIGGITAFTQDIDCTSNGPSGTTNAPTVNYFANLPAVDSLAFSSSSNDGAWTLDDISITTIIV